MRLMIASLLVLGLITSPMPAGADDPAPEPPSIALRGLDPVALVDGHETAGGDGVEATHGKFRYRFATAEHKTRFDAEPGRYAVQGDRCAVMPKVPASPDIFLVHGGKIFLFGTPCCRARFAADPAAFLRPVASRKVAIFVFDGVELLDFAGPGEVFSGAGEGRAFDVFTVAASSAPVKSQGFVTVTPQYTLADCPKADILVLPGGSMRIPLADPAVTEWIRRASGEAEVTLSVCTGAFLLAGAGQLDGLEATTHHQSLAALGRAAPRAVIRAGRRFVDNGRIVTSAGVSAGIDASLHVVDRLLGHEAAQAAALLMEYPWQP